MKSLRGQLLLSHLLLIGLMLLLLFGGIARFFRLGYSIDRILDANVRSVLLMQRTKDAVFTLERTEKADATAVTAARDAIAQELGNLTEPGEGVLARKLEADFEAFLLGKASARSVSESAQAILELNLSAIRAADLRARAEARESAILGLAVTAVAAAVALWLALATVRGALLPLVSLARQASEIGEGRLNQRISVDRNDEIGTLASAFNTMAERVSDARAALQTRAERAESVSDTALQSLYDPVLVTDADGRLSYCNAAAQTLFPGRLGQSVNEARLARAIDRAIAENRAIADDTDDAHLTLAGQTFRIRVSPLPTRLGAVAILEDITALREVDRLKTEFIAVASHELRTPVSSLLLSTQLLLEGAAGPLSDDQSEIVGGQRDDLLRLERLLNDLLDIGRLERGGAPLAIRSVALSELVGDALATVRLSAREKGVELRAEPLNGTVRVDLVQISRVLVNLLGNAIRHTPAGGEVVVSARPDGEFLAISVRDTGDGIPGAYLSRVFDRLTQVPGATGGGAGLGLSLAKSIIEAHGGEIRAESDGPGFGATFTFTLRKDEEREK